MSTTIESLRKLGLKVNGTEPTNNNIGNVINEIADNYSPSEAGMSNPMTTAGDIIVGGASGAPTRLAKGTQGQVLSVGSSGLEWANASSGGSGLYKHVIKVNDGEQDQYITLVHLSSTAATTAAACIELTSPSDPNITPSWLNNVILGPGWYFLGFRYPDSTTSGNLNLDILKIDPQDQTVSAMTMECTFISDTVTAL